VLLRPSQTPSPPQCQRQNHFVTESASLAQKPNVMPRPSATELVSLAQKQSVIQLPKLKHFVTVLVSLAPRLSVMLLHLLAPLPMLLLASEYVYLCSRYHRIKVADFEPR
jgi:hypothetical protein